VYSPSCVCVRMLRVLLVCVQQCVCGGGVGAVGRENEQKNLPCFLTVGAA
jgi:hypothetical protein